MPTNTPSSSLRPLCATVLLCITLSAVVAASAPADQRYRLLFDDYYQKDRSDRAHTQGVALATDDRPYINHYHPDVNAASNGTFAFRYLIANKFRLEVSDQPISAALLASTDAYMLVCPIKQEAGGRAALTETDVALLEKFVDRGGMLLLVFNSIRDPAEEEFDYVGMNRIARKFGIELQLAETGTLTVPPASDDPIFHDIDNIIYGNGNTLHVLPEANPATKVVLRDPREGKDGAPLAVIAPHGRGRVLIFGDAGTFGNAHLFRDDLNHAQALAQMIDGLLPDGPLPAYGWKKGQRLRVRLQHEQLFSGYEHENRLMALPMPERRIRVESKPRAHDLASAPSGTAGAVAAADTTRYTTNLLKDAAAFTLSIGAFDGRAFAATWQGDSKQRIRIRLLPRGTVIDASVPAEGDLAHWQWALGHELFCTPLPAYARPGDTWEADGMTPLPHGQLSPTPTLARAHGTYRFEGEVTYAGRACFLITRAARVDSKGWRFQDLVHPAYVNQFGPEQIELMAGGQLAVSKFWIDKQSRLPVRTELTISSSVWWKDRLYRDRYEGGHDWRTFETWRTVNFIGDFGRRLVAEFEVE